MLTDQAVFSTEQNVIASLQYRIQIAGNGIDELHLLHPLYLFLGGQLQKVCRFNIHVFLREAGKHMSALILQLFLCLCSIRTSEIVLDADFSVTFFVWCDGHELLIFL